MAPFLPPTATSDTPSAAQVRGLYLAASAEPPLNEGEAEADLFAGVHAACLRDDEVCAALVHEGDALVGLAYGHRWSWEEQRYPWADSLRSRLGPFADRLEGAHALCLLARHPSAAGRGLGREVLTTWLAGIGPVACWLQATDVDSPARRLYDAHGVAIGHGPDAPDGTPGLVMLREAPSSAGSAG